MLPAIARGGSSRARRDARETDDSISMGDYIDAAGARRHARARARMYRSLFNGLFYLEANKVPRSGAEHLSPFT